MKFGKVEHPELIDYTLPEDRFNSKQLFRNKGKDRTMELYVGTAKWGKKDLKNFYPKGVKEELPFYAKQFNSIELNATFYRIFPREQYIKWKTMVPADFRFFPKMVQTVSHLRRLNEMAYPALERYLDATANFENNLGTIFLQMHPNFGPKNWDRVVHFVENWPKEFALAVEFRQQDWFRDEILSQELYHLLETNNISNILVDTAGRRDLLHMRLTNNEAFIRFVATNQEVDYERINTWVNKLEQWHKSGLRKIDFFIHQTMQSESSLLATFLIDKLNKRLKSRLVIPKSIK